MLTTQANHPILGNLLDNRYQVIQILSARAFRRSYIAEDTASSGKPKQVIIKHLKPASDDQKFWQTVRHLFVREVQMLKKLGEHDQIPQFLTHFEDDQGFYWVQEFIQGQPLSNLLPTGQRCGKRWTETQTIKLLKEVLDILKFIHSQNLIHCDIKPNNLIKRLSDGKLFLIDFGAVQPVQIPQAPFPIPFTPTPAGYIPAEQLASQPRPNSDIYAVGMIALQALTGLHPTQLQTNSHKNWQQEFPGSNELAAIINQMVQSDCQNRYQTAAEALNSIDRIGFKDPKSETKYELNATLQLESEVPSEEVKAPLQPESQHELDEKLELENPVYLEGFQDLIQSEIEHKLDETLELENPVSLEEIQAPLQPETKYELAVNFKLENPVFSGATKEPVAFPLQFRPETVSLILSPFEFPHTFLAAPTVNLEPNKVISRRRPTNPLFPIFSLGMITNTLVTMAGLIYISQPAPRELKKVEQFINEDQWLAGAEQICQIPYICFWQKNIRPLSKEKVHKIIEEAYAHAIKRDFAGAITHLKQIPPGSPRYDHVKAKIAEYEEKIKIKAEAERIANIKE